MAHYEPPHQDLHCLQIQLFSSQVVKELIHVVDILPVNIVKSMFQKRSPGKIGCTSNKASGINKVIIFVIIIDAVALGFSVWAKWLNGDGFEWGKWSKE